MSKSYAIWANEVTKRVDTAEGQIEILRPISLRVEQGKSLAIVGPSGSGKSTLLSVLAGLDSASGGQNGIMDEELTKLGEDQRAQIRRQYVSFVFQSFQLLGHLTVQENVEFGLEVQGRVDPVRVKNAIEEVGLTHRMRHYPRTLSGGEQQRVAIARALACAPAVLFADEPTGSLDRKNGAKIEELLFDLAKKNGASLIIVTHDMHLAQKADEIFNMEQV